MGGLDCRQRLCRAAGQSRETAAVLDALACWLREAVCRTDDICCLLAADKSLEQALSRALWTELCSIQDLCGP